jgi:hypothetical protein
MTDIEAMIHNKNRIAALWENSFRRKIVTKMAINMEGKTDTIFMANILSPKTVETNFKIIKYKGGCTS